MTLFKVAFLLQNVNPASPGYSENIWVTAGVYRSDYPGLDTSGSAGWNYQFGSWNFTNPAINPDPNADFVAGKWVTYDADMMPLIHLALNAAWENWGMLPNSHDLNDLKFTIFESQWESGERIKCEMQLRNMSFKAVLGTYSPPQTSNTLLQLTQGSDWGTLANWQYDNEGMRQATSLPALTNDTVVLVDNSTIASGTAAQTAACEVGVYRDGAVPITLNISGSLTASVNLSIAFGTSGTAVATGTVNVLNGGVVDANALYVGYNGGNGALIISPGGTVSCKADWGLHGWITSGAIRAAPGATLVVDWHTGDPARNVYRCCHVVMPTFVAAGSVASGTGAITPALPANIATGDILLLFLETANQAISITNQNGGTWTAGYQLAAGNRNSRQHHRYQTYGLLVEV